MASFFAGVRSWNKRRSYEGRHHLKPSKNDPSSVRTPAKELMDPKKAALVGYPSRRKPAGLWVDDVWQGGKTTKKPAKYPSTVYRGAAFDLFPYRGPYADAT